MTTEPTERDLIEEVEELLAKYPRGGVTFPQPSRSRTRDVLNDYGCGCQVRRDGAGAHLIHACATHNSAPELLRRLVEEVKRLRLKVDAITGSRIRDLLKDEHDD